MIIMCPHCGGLNRVADDKLAQQPKCGKCQHALFTGSPVEMNHDQFQRAMQKTEHPLVVDFWAPWCGPCQGFAPVFKQAAQAYEPKARFVKINTENEQQLGAELGIRSIPTLAIFKNGQELTRMSGAMNFQQFSQWLDQNLSQ